MTIEKLVEECATCRFYKAASDDGRKYLRGGWCAILLPIGQRVAQSQRVEWPESQRCDLHQPKDTPHD